MTRRVLCTALAALALALASAAIARTAERYLAADGFSAPERVVQLPSRTAAALALDGATPVVFWYDPAGVHRRALIGEPDERQLVSDRGLRGLGAVAAGGDPAVLRVVRDFQTGRNEHVLAWRDQERVIADALEVLPVALAAGEEGPVWVLRGRAGGRGFVTLEGWNREPVVVRDAGVSLGGYDLAVAADGVAWVGWLEGTTERSAFGVVSNWSAYVARVDADGAAGPALELGEALRRSDIDRLRLAVGPTGAVQALWPREDGSLVATTLTPAADAADPLAEAVRADAVLGRGVSLAVLDGTAYWADADRVMARSLEPGASSRAVLWAPHAIEGGDGLITPAGDTVLTWYGGALRGSWAVYAADTADPFDPTWLDHAAAAMGWNPWNLWSEALGQVLASLLAGVLVTMALSPILWAGSALAVRLGSIHDGTWVGIGIGGATFLLAVGTIRLRATLPPEAIDALFGVWWHLAIALAAAVALTLALRRGRDTEPLLGTLLAAASCAGVATAVLAFATYQAWAASWQGIL